MNEIAPWENPKLSAPFANIEREIENRTRHFALWQWDERLVWRDLKTPRLWWATLDVAASLADWESAIETASFGRAFTSDCNKAINGKRIGLSTAVTFRLSRTFLVIVSNNGAGVAREKEENFWLQFTPQDDEYTRHKRERAPSVWHPNREFFGINREIMRAFAPIFLDQFSRGFRLIITQGRDADALVVMKDLVAWNVSRKILFTEWMKSHSDIYQKIISYFDLPPDSSLSIAGERKQINGVQLGLRVAGEYQQWNLGTSVSPVTTMHESLELQLRLRDALRPILTDAEIEEILNPSARL